MTNTATERILNCVRRATSLKRPLLDLHNLTYTQMRDFYEKMEYPFYTEKKEFNLNIGAIRSSDLTPNIFNDITFLAWEWLGKGHLHIFKATTDPGLTYLLHPQHPVGTAIIVPGYYKGVYHVGYHRRNTTFSHQALRQHKKMKYWRVSNYQIDSQIPINNDKVYTELAYTNLHSYPLRMKEQELVNNLSMGCMVNKENHRHFSEFIPICKEGEKNFGKSLSFALFYEPELI